MNRPEQVLQKGENQTVTCQCGHTFDVSHVAYEATCPKCKNVVNWGLHR